MATVRSTMLAIILVCGLMKGAFAASYKVGDSTGWTLPNSPTFFDDWAAKHSFAVGDKLTFTYTTGHNVYQVSPADYAACEGTAPIAMYTGANPEVTLNTTGEICFICEVPGHCGLGMKMCLTVAGNGTAPTKAPSAKTPPGSLSPSASPPAPSPSTNAASGLQFNAPMIVGSFLAVGALVL